MVNDHCLRQPYVTCPLSDVYTYTHLRSSRILDTPWGLVFYNNKTPQSESQITHFRPLFRILDFVKTSPSLIWAPKGCVLVDSFCRGIPQSRCTPWSTGERGKSTWVWSSNWKLFSIVHHHIIQSDLAFVIDILHETNRSPQCQDCPSNVRHTSTDSFTAPARLLKLSCVHPYNLPCAII